MKGANMRARTTDPVTSHEAGEQVKNLTETKKAILKILKKKDYTDSQLFMLYHGLAVNGKAPYASESGVRSRRAELVKDNLVEAKGFDKTQFGRRTIVWGLKRG